MTIPSPRPSPAPASGQPGPRPAAQGQPALQDLAKAATVPTARPAAARTTAAAEVSHHRRLLWVQGGILVVCVAILLVLLALLFRRPAATPPASPPPSPVAAAAASPLTARSPTPAEATPAVVPEPPQPPAPAAASGYPMVTPAGRSPLPQPGENFDRPIPARRLDDQAETPNASSPPPPQPAPAAPPPASAEQVVPWNEAHRHVGQTITIEGHIVNTRNTGKVCFLNFSRDTRSGFYIVIFEDALKAWPEPPERRFLNQTVRLRAKVHTHSDRPQMRVDKGNSSDLQIIGQ